MDTTEPFASQWQSLKEKERQLIGEAEQFKQKLNSLTAEPAMRQLLEEKGQLKKKIQGLRDEVKMHKSAISVRLWWLGQRRLAMTDRKIQQKLAWRLGTRRERLACLKKMNAPKALIENETRMVFELEAPIDEVGRFYQEKNVEEGQKQLLAQKVLDEILARIVSIEDYYRQTKHCLEEAVREIERKQQMYRAERIEWAAQSRGHLEWMLEHEPSYKDDAVRRYGIRFPSDSLVDLFPPTLVPTSVVPRTNGKRRHSQPVSSPPVAEVIQAVPETWRFWITFNPNDFGQELPHEKNKFLSTLQSALDKADYRGLNIKIAYDKLLAVGKMTMQQRQEINKIVEAEPLGWKILRVGKKHRLFLLIDEEKRHIRFLPCQRKKSYLQH